MMAQITPVSDTPPTDAALRHALWRSVRAFVGWLDRNGPASHDPYDLWGTWCGIISRRLYYRAGVLGLPFIAPFVLLEALCPQLKRLLVRPQRYATADGQLCLAFLNLFKLTEDRAYLKRAIDLAQDLVDSSIPGYSGLCWGYPFDWQNDRALWKKDTPYITATPYCFEAFLELLDVTGNIRYRELAESVARFVHQDLRDTPTSETAAAGSYSPIDNDKVINASAYRAFVLVESAHRFGRPDYLETARKNLNFILENQREDGAWLYAATKSSYIDHFHTCFVLKNLIKLNRRLEDESVRRSIWRGYDYYRRHLFGPGDHPKPFACPPRAQIHRLEMYDVAEAITLGTLLKDEIPEAFELAQTLARRACQEYQLPDGHFITRIYRGGWRHTFPYLRWPQAQVFYALTNMRLAL